MRKFYLLVLILVVAGCTNHPLVDDATGYSTYDVIHKARCEAKESLQHYYEDLDFHESMGEHDDLTLAIKREEKIQSDTKWADLQKNLAILNPDIERNFKRLNSINLQIAAIDRVPGATGPIAASDAFRKKSSASRKAWKEEIIESLRRLKAFPDAWNNAIQGLLDRALEIEKELALLAAEEQKLKQQINPMYQNRLAQLKARQADAEAMSTVLKKEQKERKKPIEPYQMSFKRLKALSERLAGTKANGLKPFNKFMKTNIAMQFRFDITETNNGTANGSFKFPVHFGSVTIGYKSGATKKRQGNRAVGIEANVKDLLVLDCEDAKLSERQHARIYPITGNMGIGELVQQYLTIAESATLRQHAVSVGTAKKFVDKLIFTTTFSGGIQPSFVLNPTPAHEIKFDGDFNAERKDVHEVIVDIAPPPAPKPKEDAPAPTRIVVESVPEVGINIIRETDFGTVQ